MRTAFTSNAFLLAVLFAAGLSLLGCKKTGSTVTAPVQTNLEYNYTYDKREVFIADANADLTELDQKINQFSESAMSAGAVVKAAAQSKIEDLRKQRATLDQKLNGLSSAKESNWNALKTDYQNAESKMKMSLRASWQWMHDNSHS